MEKYINKKRSEYSQVPAPCGKTLEAFLRSEWSAELGDSAIPIGTQEINEILGSRKEEDIFLRHLMVVYKEAD